MLLRSSALVLAVAALSTGCATASTVSAPRVPVPVLLGPVDRIGGGRDADAESTPFSVEVEDFASARRDQKQVGNLVFTRTTSVKLHEGEAKVSALVLGLTDAQHDRDVHVHRVRAGAWVWITPDCASMMRESWIDLDASVTKGGAR
jgi:hypothetical protein